MVFPSGLAAADSSQSFENVSDLSGSGASVAGGERNAAQEGDPHSGFFKYTKRCVTMQQVFVRFAPDYPKKAKKIRRKKRRIFLN